MDQIVINNLLNQLKNKVVMVENKTKNKTYEMEISLSGRAIEILKSGGLLNFISKKVIK
jgi:hypothetical protein